MRRFIAFAFALSVCLAADHPMLPDPKLTPGATDSRVTQANIHTTICQPGYTATVRSVPQSVKHQVMVRYGLPISDLSLVEIDHDISLEIGGSNEVANLWPQYYDPAPGQVGYLGAREKDVVETALHRQVCSGEITLKQAQDAIRHWPEVYRQIKGIASAPAAR
jgi:hypothetical protein